MVQRAVAAEVSTASMLTGLPRTAQRARVFQVQIDKKAGVEAMTDRIEAGALQVDKELYDFINDEALPGTGISPEAFWSGFDSVIHDLSPRNRELLATRDELQARIDAWYQEHRDQALDLPAYRAFLQEIGYLIPEGGDFTVSTAKVDPEITTTAGPQLVVPVTNARYSLNAANARWGSLYDALYGTDVISEEGGAERAGDYNKVRGARVIAFARDFLDSSAPLASGSHRDTTSYAVTDGALAVTLQDGSVSGLAEPSKFAGYAGDAAAPSAVLLQNNGLHVDVAARQAELQSRSRADLDSILTIPRAERLNWPEHDIQQELKNNAQDILGYVVRWIDQGVGCSKVPDINNIGLMEDRATLRISSQHIANWLRHGVCSEDQVRETMQRMAAVVDGQNAGDPRYRPMAPSFDDSVAFQAACDLVFKGREQPNGYTEPILHARRQEAKAKFGS